MHETVTAEALTTSAAAPAAPQITDPDDGAPASAAATGPTTDAHPAGPTEPVRRAALSPSRAKDFLQCPLLFRFRAVDRLPEPPSLAATKGTLVHSVLERLFDLPAQRRTETEAHALLDPEWAELQAQRPEVTQLFANTEDLTGWLQQARSLLSMYFRMEDPRRLEPAERETLVETELSSGVLLRGFIDRMDVAPDGAVRVVDYKTGKSPHPRFQDEALFQMRFYALMLWRLHGVVPRRLQLVFLGDGRTLTHDPVEEELVAVEEQVNSLWERITAAARTEEFRPRPTKLCGWCSFQDLCPSFGGTPPEPPTEGLRRLLESAAAR